MSKEASTCGSELAREARRPERSRASSLPQTAKAFTLLELLVVIGLIAALSFVLIGGLGGGGKSAALQSAQATLVNMITAARMKAVATGRDVRLLINTDETRRDRFLRYIAIQMLVGTTWETMAEAMLPEGTGVIPSAAATAANLLAPGKSWIRGDGKDLRSSILSSAEVSTMVNDTAAGQWLPLQFTGGRGTVSNQGDIVVGVMRPVSPAEQTILGVPAQFVDPEQVRGVSISSYGVPALINSRVGF